jgi:L-alanine-DL-glutamate epimerase-like enolase superfamily enzyme
MKNDESAHDMDTLVKAHALGCMDVATLALSKFGGLSAVRRARDFCPRLMTMMAVEDAWGSDIATPSRYLLNACDLSGYVTPRVAPDGPLREAGRLAPAERPGLGVNPDEAVLGKAIAVYR